MQYVLVHGAWLGGWCWEPLALRLRQLGHSVSCIDLPGHGAKRFLLPNTTYAMYYQSLVDEIKKYQEPVVLVAHSMAGMLAAPIFDQLPDRVAHLFLIGGLVPQNGRTLIDEAMGGGPSEIFRILLVDAENRAQSLDPKKVKNALFLDCPSEVADWAIRQLQPQPIAPVTAPVYWIDSEKTLQQRTYLICEDDAGVHPITQRNVLKHYPCRTISLKTGHFPFLSQPDFLVELITFLRV